MPWVTAFGGKVLMGVSGLAMHVSALNDDFGVQERDALFGPDVNLMVGWKLLISCRNCWSLSSPAVQIAKSVINKVPPGGWSVCSLL